MNVVFTFFRHFCLAKIILSTENQIKTKKTSAFIMLVNNSKKRKIVLNNFHVWKKLRSTFCENFGSQRFYLLTE